MKVTIERLEGERDAIRFGRVRFSEGQRVMAFVYDRLSGVIVLMHHENHIRCTAPPSEAEEAAARRALHRFLPPLAPGAHGVRAPETARA